MTRTDFVTQAVIIDGGVTAIAGCVVFAAVICVSVPGQRGQQIRYPSRVKNRTVILASLFFAVACASNIAKSSEPPAVAEVKLVEMSPVAGSELMPETVLVAKIRYSIKNFKPGVDYYVAPVFSSTEGSGVTFSMADRLSDSTRILSADGTVTAVRCDVRQR